MLDTHFQLNNFSLKNLKAPMITRCNRNMITTDTRIHNRNPKSTSDFH